MTYCSPTTPAFAGLAHDLQELRFETRAQLARRPARGGERRAGVLAHLTAVVEQRGERGLDLGRLRQAVGDGGEQREAVGIATQVHAHAARHEQQVAHLEQAPRLQRRAGRRGLRQRRRETRHVRRGQRSGLAGQRHQLRQRVEPPLGFGALDGGPEGPHRVAAGLGARQRGDRLQRARQLEGVEIARSHRRRS